MKSFIKKVITVITIAGILALSLGAAYGASKPVDYTALGDSIAYGYGNASNGSYVDLFYTYLKTEKNRASVKLSNFAVPGDTSADLLSKLQTDLKMQGSIKNSNIVTVSIGGNNILGPTIAYIAKAFDVNPVNNPNLATDLAKAMLLAPDRDARLAEVMKPDKLPATLGAEVKKFMEDWPKIIGAIKALSPKAEIYIMTLYNPFSPKDLFHGAFDIAVQGINSVIATPNTLYKVVDVYTLFNKYTGPSPLTNFDMSKMSLDPHPTGLGHKMIFHAHLGAYLASNKKIAGTVVTRAGFITVLVKTLGLSANGASNFADVKKNDYFYNGVAIAKKLGLTSGAKGNKFLPNDGLTRQDMMVMVSKAIKLSGKVIKPGNVSELKAFSDFKKLPGSAQKSAADLIKNGIIEVKDNKISPDKKVTVGEMAKILGILVEK